MHFTPEQPWASYVTIYKQARSKTFTGVNKDQGEYARQVMVMDLTVA